MQLTDQRLNFYLDNVIAFRSEDKKKYQDQVDHLKTTLTNAIHSSSAVKVTSINQAGSWRKGTALKPRDGFDLDIDLVVYLDLSEATKSDVATLHEVIIGLLCAAYPTKPRSDFTPSKRTVGIVFRTSGLRVDLVPIVPVKEPASFGWQPDVGGTGVFMTSPTKQLEFIRALKDQDPRYASVVRLVKRWRNVAELSDELSSFSIELITAHVVGTVGPPPSLEEGLLRVLAYVAQSQLKLPISFKDAIRSVPATPSAVRIFDPTNNENNVAGRMTDENRKAVVDRATAALETLNYAQTIAREGDTLTCWKEVFGPSFKTDEG
jgi:hypothetical protein